MKAIILISSNIACSSSPRALACVSGDPILAQIAMDAIALWRYEPATLDGEPVESEVIIPIDFQLPN